MTDQACTLTPAEARWYVPGPLKPAAVSDMLRGVYIVLRTTRGSDVFSALYDGDKANGTALTMPELDQVARTVLSVLVGIGALEVREPVRALQLWQARNEDATLLWAFGETLALVSAQDRIMVERDRAVGREHRRRVPAREDAA